MRKKHIRIGNKFDCVEGVRSTLKESRWLYDGLNRIGCGGGLSVLLIPTVTEHEQVIRDRMTGSEISVRDWKTTLTEPLRDSEVRDPIPKKGGGAGVRQKRTLSKTSSSKRLLPSSRCEQTPVCTSIEEAWTATSKRKSVVCFFGVRFWHVQSKWKFNFLDSNVQILWDQNSNVLESLGTLVEGTWTKSDYLANTLLRCSRPCF